MGGPKFPQKNLFIFFSPSISPPPKKEKKSINEKIIFFNFFFFILSKEFTGNFFLKKILIWRGTPFCLVFPPKKFSFGGF